MTWFPSTERNIYVIGFYPSPETNDENRLLVDNAFSALGCWGANVQIISEPGEAMDLDLPGSRIKPKKRSK